MKGLPRAVIPIYGIVFIDVLGLTILIPMLPALAKTFHASPAAVAILISLTAICATVSSPFWGKTSDRFGRKNVLQLSQAFSLVGYTVLAISGLSGSILLAFVSRAIEGLGGGNLGVAQSYIADVTEEKDRERAFAFGAAAFGIGFVFGPVMSGQLLKLGVAVPFFVAAGLEALNIVVTHVFLPETGEHSAAETVKTSEIARELSKKPMLNLMTRQFLYIFSFTYFFTVFSLYLERELHMDPSTSSLFLGLAGAIGAIVQIFAVDRLDKRLGEYALAQGGFVLAFVAYALMFFIHGLGMFVGILAIWAASGAILRPTLNNLISQHAPERERGAILGFADSLNNAAMIFAPAIGGVIIGVNSQLIGIVPAIAVASAFGLGLIVAHRSIGEQKRSRSSVAA